MITDRRTTVTGQSPSLATGSRYHTLGFVKYQVSESSTAWCPRVYDDNVTTITELVSSQSGMDTYQLSVQLGGSAFNLHIIFGTSAAPMQMPDGQTFQVASAEFGVDMGGISADAIAANRAVRLVAHHRRREWGCGTLSLERCRL